jgi:hypothetical protein
MTKDKRYVFRLTERRREYLRRVCFELGEPLPELLVMGVVMLRREVSTRADYLRLKAELLEGLVEEAGYEPLDS